MSSTHEQPEILVTGCAGFIGSRVCQLLLHEGWTVVGMDNLNDDYDIRLKEYRIDRLSLASNFKFHLADIEVESEIQSVFRPRNFRAVIHLAARAGVRESLNRPNEYMQTNVLGCLNLLEAMRENHISKLVLSSTSSLYAGQPTPFSESATINPPKSPYAASKKCAEDLALIYHNHYGIDVSLLRFFTVYGPVGRPDMCLHRMIHWMMQGEPIQIYGDGKQSRDFIYVDDVARGSIAALRPLGYEVINLGGGKPPVSLLELIELLKEITGLSAAIEFHDAHPIDLKSTSADIGKANELLDWQPATPLKRGLSECVNWYRANLPWSATICLDRIQAVSRS